MIRESVKIRHLQVSSYTVPTDAPEADGTLNWDKATLVLVQVGAGDKEGLGFTYADSTTAELVRTPLVELIEGRDAMDIPGAWSAMVHAIRNLGRAGIASMAIAAVDNALWDLKAKILDLPLVGLLGTVRTGVPVCGSGGFTSYSDKQLADQLGGWVAQGIPRVKMKVGAHPDQDLHRVQVAREAIGRKTELFVEFDQESPGFDSNMSSPPSRRWRRSQMPKHRKLSDNRGWIRPKRNAYTSSRQDRRGKAPIINLNTERAIVIKDHNVFFLMDPDGSVPVDRLHGLGLYYHDCRYLDGYEIRIGGTKPHP